MRIVCPSCQAAYDVPAPVLQAGRVLRCVRCAADFTPGLQAAPRTPVVAAPRIVVAPEPAVPAPSAVQQRGLPVEIAAAWALSLIVLVGLAWGAVAWRRPIVRAWPASGRAYAALGYDGGT